MSERLITFEQIGSALNVSGRTIRRNIHRLKARGLQQVVLPVGRNRLGKEGKIRFRESSLDRLIKRAAERDEPLF